MIRTMKSKRPKNVEIRVTEETEKSERNSLRRSIFPNYGVLNTLR